MKNISIGRYGVAYSWNPEITFMQANLSRWMKNSSGHVLKLLDKLEGWIVPSIIAGGDSQHVTFPLVNWIWAQFTLRDDLLSTCCETPRNFQDKAQSEKSALEST